MQGRNTEIEIRERGLKTPLGYTMSSPVKVKLLIAQRPLSKTENETLDANMGAKSQPTFHEVFFREGRPPM